MRLFGNKPSLVEGLKKKTYKELEFKKEENLSCDKVAKMKERAYLLGIKVAAMVFINQDIGKDIGEAITGLVYKFEEDRFIFGFREELFSLTYPKEELPSYRGVSYYNILNGENNCSGLVSLSKKLSILLDVDNCLLFAEGHGVEVTSLKKLLEEARSCFFGNVKMLEDKAREREEQIKKYGEQGLHWTSLRNEFFGE